jgi:2-iminobutanoate/2-iminopropanoate deaminase
MAWRESFNVPPMIHQNPIPTASRTGPLLFTSGISGRDLETGQVPDDAEAQARNCFRILQAILDKFGAKTTDVAHIAVQVRDNAAREHVNKYWLEMFPDANSRPARHTVVNSDMGGWVSMEAVAVVEGR